MKRYLLFCGDRYYPSGGWEDFKGSFNSIEDAIAAAQGFAETHDSFLVCDWYHVVDTQNPQLEIVRHGKLR